MGQVKPGYLADILLVAGGNPAQDLSLLHEPPRGGAPPGAVGGAGRAGARGVVAVFKDGLLARGGCVRPAASTAQQAAQQGWSAPHDLNRALFMGTCEADAPAGSRGA